MGNSSTKSSKPSNKSSNSNVNDDLPPSTAASSTDFLLVNGNSLIKTPSAQALGLRGWLSKRGHVVRNWKRRYFILTSIGLKYYKKELPIEPYGGDLCGEMSLRGAVLNISTHNNFLKHIQIVGRHGEKDLLIEIDPNDAKQSPWIDALHWTIRKCNQSYITKELQGYHPEPSKQFRGCGKFFNVIHLY